MAAMNCRRVIEMIRQQERNKGADMSGQFQADLKKARDGFDVVADYFGKGIFDKVTFDPLDYGLLLLDLVNRLFIICLGLYSHR